MNINKIKMSKTDYIGRQIIYKNEVESTQSLAKDLVKNDYIYNGTVIITDNQTKGKGTHGRVWNTSKGKNITMTIILKPNCDINLLDKLTIQIAEAIKIAIKELYGYDLIIKYPNDLLLNGKKICGILTQSSTTKNIVNYILIGIGFNVNEERFPENLKEIATSLKKEYLNEFNREDIIIKILKEIEKIMPN